MACLLAAPIYLKPVVRWSNSAMGTPQPDPAPNCAEITLLLRRVTDGDADAEAALLQLVYLELHRIAGRLMRRERSGHTLQPTALVNEAYLRLCKEGGSANWENRVHFFNIAARVMRRILTDHARRRLAEKRGGGEDALQIDFGDAAASQNAVDLTQVLTVDKLLRELAEVNPLEAQIVEMRFFAGMTEEEIAAALGLSRRTVVRRWLKARAWLYARMFGDDGSAAAAHA